jgi:uncharacterized membrane protein YfhO
LYISNFVHIVTASPRVIFPSTLVLFGLLLFEVEFTLLATEYKLSGILTKRIFAFSHLFAVGSEFVSFLRAVKAIVLTIISECYQS